MDESHRLFRQVCEKSEARDRRLEDCISAGFSSFNSTLLEALKIQSYEMQKVVIECVRPTTQSDVNATSQVPLIVNDHTSDHNAMINEASDDDDDSHHDSPINPTNIKMEYSHRNRNDQSRHPFKNGIGQVIHSMTIRLFILIKLTKNTANQYEMTRRLVDLTNLIPISHIRKRSTATTVRYNSTRITILQFHRSINHYLV